MGSFDCDPCERTGRRQANPADPRDLADQLDHGRAGTVVDALQRDAYTMRSTDFQRLVQTVAATENPRYGDNLAVARNGDIVISREDGQRFRVGNLFRQDEMANAYERHHPEAFARQQHRNPAIYDRDGQRPYYDPRESGYRPSVATPPYFEDRGYDSRGYDPRLAGRSPNYDPSYDRGYYDRGYDRGYSNRDIGQQVLRDGIQGALVGELSGGRAGKGALANIGIGLLFGNGRRW